MRDLARDAARTGNALPEAYLRLYCWWFASGVPAFLTLLAIVWLMAARPQFN
jgi:uncharacterized membrane protein